MLLICRSHITLTYLCYDVGTTSSQSEDKKPMEKTADFVFYPSDSSSDLAFSVNLRNIAKHYIHDEKVRNVLTAKANEHLNAKKNSISQNSIKIMTNDGNFKGSERNLGWTDIRNKNVSKLGKFLSRNYPHLSQDAAQSGKRSETFHKPVRKQLGVKITVIEVSLALVA